MSVPKARLFLPPALDCGCQDGLNSLDISTSSAKGRLMCPSAFSMTSRAAGPR